MSEYETEGTPELDDLEQLPEHDAVIEVPVRVVNDVTVQTHELPARNAVMRNVYVDSVVQQIAGANLRRKKITVWATGEDPLTDFVYVGTDKNEVESDTAAMLPADNTVLVMSHAVQLWVKAPSPVTLSFVAEDWAD